MLSFDNWVADLPPLTIGVPILVSCLVLAAGRFIPRIAVDVIAIICAAAMACLDAIVLAKAADGHVVTWMAQWTPVHGRSVGIVLEADGLGAAIALLAACLVVLSLVFSVRYLPSVEAHYHALILLFLAGMEGYALTGDLFDLLVFFELMGAAAYGITALVIEDPSALQGALNFGVVNSLGAYFSLMGIGLLYARTSDLQMALIGHDLTGHPPDALVVAAFVLVATGLVVKGAVVPFHFWFADAQAVAPAPACMLFSGVMLPLGIYGLLRVYWQVFSGVIVPADARLVFLTLGAATAVIGAVMCASQRHLKRLLAYATIAHGGLFLVALGLLDTAGTQAGALYVAGGAGIKAALFLLAGMILDRYRTCDEIELFGRCRDAPAIGVLVALGGLGLAGLPPFGTGLGDSIAVPALRGGGETGLVALFVLVSALTGAAVLRSAARMFLGLGRRPYDEPKTRTEEQPPEGRLTWKALIPIAVLYAGALAVGLIPGATDAAARAASAFIDRGAYLRAALGHASAPPTATSSAWTAAGVLVDAASVALACGFCAAALYGEGALRRVPVLRRAWRQIGSGLHHLHSGHLGDYVAWLMAGTALIAGLVGFPLR